MPDPCTAPVPLQPLQDFAEAILARAGEQVLNHFRAAVPVQQKGSSGFDPVTCADKEAEAMIRAAIAERWPAHGICGEEAGVDNADARLGWTIDPIDGTRSFIAGFAHWGMLLAFTDRGRPVLGCLHQPYLGETFTGSALGASLLRDGHRRPLATRPCPQLGEAIISTTDPYLFTGHEQQQFTALRKAVRLVRYGNDCYAYAMLAAGQIDLVIESGLQPWDVHGLMPLVAAAGGVMSDWQGQDCAAGGQVIAAGDAHLHHAVIRLLADT